MVHVLGLLVTTILCYEAGLCHGPSLVSSFFCAYHSFIDTMPGVLCFQICAGSRYMCFLQGRTHIFKIHAAKMNVEKDIRYELLARLCTNNTGCYAVSSLATQII